MTKKIRNLISSINTRKKQQTDFSEFFHKASAGEKKKLLLKVIKEANRDQQKLIDKYNSFVTKPV